jgi:DNA primase
MTFTSQAIPADDMAPEHRLLTDDLDVVEVLESAGVQFIDHSGNECRARCPFHPDDISSFRADRVSGIWRCHACGRSGDTLDFLVSYLDEPFGSVVARLTGDSDDQS